jgi:hypothetical protein
MNKTLQMLPSMAALVSLACVATANAASDTLERQITARDGWVAYRVPKIADGNQGPCCYVVNGSSAVKKGCDLDGRTSSFGTTDKDAAAAAAPDDTLAVYLRVERGSVQRIRALSASCPTQTATPVRWIDAVEPANSVALLSSLLDRHTARDQDDHGLVAIAYHADASATRALASRAEPSHAHKEREQALFWLGQVRGAEGADIIERYATTDSDPKIREHAVFALSQSKETDAYPHILAIAQRDPTEDVRSKALFWLAQMDDQRAKDDIIASLNAESSSEVQEQAIFALSQLDDGVGEDALIAVLNGKYPREVKKQALFWLGQSGSPRAMAYFDEALK